MPIRRLIGTSGNVADVDSNGNVKTNLPMTPALAGFVNILAEGEEIGSAGDGRLDVGQDTLLFEDFIDGAAIDAIKWHRYATTQTLAQSGGFLVLNNSNINTASTGSLVQSIMYFTQYGEGAVYAKLDALITQLPLVNNATELGLGTLVTQAATAGLTDFVGFRWRPDGTFACELWWGGVQLASVAVAAPSANVLHAFELKMTKDEAEFEIDHVEVAAIAVPAGYPSITSNARLPLLARTYNPTFQPSAATQLKLGGCVVAQKIYDTNKLWQTAMTAMGRGAYHSPVTAFAQTANHANSTNPTSATLSNTTAGYATLGGRYQFAAPAGAATDYAIFAYLVPSGYRLMVTGLSISCVNTGAPVATTETILDWSVGVNASAVSLATADNFTTNAYAPRRIPVGMQAFLVSDLAGKQAQNILSNFDTPLCVNGGRYLHIILQVPAGTATPSEVFRGDVMINGWFE